MSTDNTIIKINAAADILGGTVFYANEIGADPEYLDNDGLLPNGMHIRLEGSDGSIAYISAFEIDTAIHTIREMSKNKASQSDVDALQELLESKASDVDLELLANEVANKATKSDLESLAGSFTGKADQETVDALIAALNEKASKEFVNEINAQLSSKADQSVVDVIAENVALKANMLEVQAMLADIQSLQNTVKQLTDSASVTAITNQIQYLNNEINKRLTIDDLGSLNADMNTAKADITGLKDRMHTAEINLSKKATTTYVQGQVATLSNNLATLVNEVENKADKSDVTVKANKTDLDTLVNRVNTINTSLADLDTEVDDQYREVTGSLQRKANKTELDAAVENVNESLSLKADKSTFNSEIGRINAKLNTLEDTQESISNVIDGNFDEIECALNNSVTEIRNTVSTQTKTINAFDKRVKTLEESATTTKETLKHSWVRVLTSREYKNLRTAPAGVSYSDRYKYPNIVYLVVDFNKPKAIYIGDVLIAQAEQKGSIGFAYTFPIVF